MGSSVGVCAKKASVLECIITNSLSLTFGITNENKAPIISSKAHVFYLCYEKKKKRRKSRSQFAKALIDSDI